MSRQGPPEHASTVHGESFRWRLEFERTQEPRALDLAVDNGFAALAALPDGDPRRPVMLGHLASHLHRRYQLTGDAAALREAVRLEREAVAACPPGDPRRAAYLHNLGTRLRGLHDRTGDESALDEACAVGREAAEAAPGKPMYLISLAAHHMARYQRRGRPDDLRRAVAWAREGLAGSDPRDPHRSAYLNITANAVSSLADHTGDRAARSEAVELARAAVAATPPTHHDLPGHRRNLAMHLRGLFRLTAETALLREAVDVTGKALDALPHGHPDRAGCRSALSETLLMLFDHTGEAELLDDALDAVRNALADTAPESPSYAPLLNNLSIVLRARHEVLHEPGARQEAIERAREAVRLAGDGPRRAIFLDTLAAALGVQDDTVAWNPAERRENVDAARRALVGTTGEERGRMLATLAWALQKTTWSPGEEKAIAEAVEHAREAVGVIPEGHRWWPSVALVLGTILLRAHELAGSTPLPEVADVLAGGLAAEGAQPYDRVACGRALALAHTRAGRPAAALGALERSIDLLPRIAPRSLVRGARERGLERHHGLAAESAAAALAAGRPERAVELLEQARGVLLAEAIGSRGRDLARIRPDLAGEMALLRDRLAEPAAAGREHAAVLAAAETRRADADRWDDLLARIRRVPGLEGFLGRPRLADLRAGMTDEPVVIVTCSAARADALILDRAGVRSVPLPGLDGAQADAWASYLRGGDVPQEHLLDLLAWLWDTIAEPVLDAVAPAPGTRLWWTPVGPLSLLPLHAAGRHLDGGGASVLDRVVSSYTPTVRSLVHARSRRTAEPAAGRALVVAVPEAAGQPPLPGVRRETAAVAGLLPGARVLGGGDAVRDELLAALPRFEVAHFACHARTDLGSPMSSGIVLAEGAPLTLASIARLDLGAARFAYLSACETAGTRVGLADEAVHLAAGFQLAGYPQVVGTLWSVSDRIAARIAAAVYGGSVQDGRLDPERVPHALHHAVRAVRDDYPRAPGLWAAHVHHGA
ncbi:CHAT domain-containing protein [Actinomadura syzygii]|uniref:CHAT domain-containing protein n=1 Tax=Actinomadura syzygii TaxID=1427538 RepID=UPI0016528B34|nr:CHAT domain-containing protein [Actinomadura syzygii]